MLSQGRNDRRRQEVHRGIATSTGLEGCPLSTHIKLKRSTSAGTEDGGTRKIPSKTSCVVVDLSRGLRTATTDEAVHELATTTTPNALEAAIAVSSWHADAAAISASPLDSTSLQQRTGSVADFGGWLPRLRVIWSDTTVPAGRSTDALVFVHSCPPSSGWVGTGWGLLQAEINDKPAIAAITARFLRFRMALLLGLAYIINGKSIPQAGCPHTNEM